MWSTFDTLSLTTLCHLVLVISDAVHDVSSFIIETKSLPDDLNFMPSLGNGHLGLTVFGDSIYMNGVYNGEKGNSRRARIPNWLNVTVELFEDEQMKIPLHSDMKKYTMNFYEGYFEWAEHYESQLLKLKQKICAHQKFNRALVYQLDLERVDTKDEIWINLRQNVNSESNAFDMTSEKIKFNGTDGTIFHGITKQVEHNLFQPKATEVYAAINKEFPQLLHMPAGKEKFSYQIILTADLKRSVALEEMENVQKYSKNIFELQGRCWNQFWNEEFSIKTEGNLELNQIINAGIFYLASSLPSHCNPHHPNNPYFGLSPTGLSRGELDDDYEGHNFWDTEIWMLPVVTQFNFNWTLELFQYRVNHLKGAMYNANITGYEGARFPWESAYTGTEVTNPCCPEVSSQEIHISADILFALEQFYITTAKNDTLCKMWSLIEETAKYLASRVIWNNQTDQYHIENVMGPDEDHENVNDNVYTNVVFKKALKFASFAEKICLKVETSNQSSKWLEISNKLFILYDQNADYHPQHKGYSKNTTVKQADTILLGYPLQFEMSNTTRLNDLNTYAKVTRTSGPAMTWSMFSINYFDIGLIDLGNSYFLKGYKDYVRPDFKVWSETKLGLKGSVNFLTGIGGFLQSIIYGYAGVRFELLETSEIRMIIKHSFLPPNTKELTIKGLKFMHSVFELKIGESINSIKCLKLGDASLKLFKDNNFVVSVKEGRIVNFQSELITIQVKEMEEEFDYYI